MKAFVHLNCFYDTPFSIKFRERVANRVKGENLLYHGKRHLNLYWKVLPFTSTYPNKHRSSVAPIFVNSVNSDSDNDNNSLSLSSISLDDLSAESKTGESSGTNEEISGYYDDYLANRPPSPLNTPRQAARAEEEMCYAPAKPKLLRSETYYPQEKYMKLDSI